MTRVFAAVPSRHKWSAAREFGELIFCLSGAHGLDEFELLREEALRALEERKYHPGSDFVALSGPFETTAVFVAIVLARHRRIRLLTYQFGRYVERAISAE